MSSPLVRVLFPIWRFFDRPGDFPRVYLRWSDTSSEWSAWERALPKLRRHWSHLFYNPQGNLHLAFESMTAHLMEAALQDDFDFAYNAIAIRFRRWTHNLAQLKSSEGLFYQFKICSEQDDVPFEDFLVSPIMCIERRPGARHSPWRELRRDLGT